MNININYIWYFLETEIKENRASFVGFKFGSIFSFKRFVKTYKGWPV